MSPIVIVALATLLSTAACSGKSDGENDPGKKNQDPIAIFVATPQTGAPPLSVAFDARASTDSDGMIVSYEWKFGDGASGSGPIVDHRYYATGRYDVELVVTDNEGGRHSAGATITATTGATLRSPMAVFSASTLRGEVPLSVDFDAGASTDPDGMIVLHVWAVDGETKSTGPNFRHIFDEVGIFEVTLKVIDKDGLFDETAMTVRVTEEGGGVPPEARFSVSRHHGFAPLTLDFDASRSDPREGHITDFSWTFGDMQSGTGAMVSHTYNASGVYTAQLSVTNSAQTLDSTSQRIVVRGAQALPFSDDYDRDRGWIVVEEGDSGGPASWSLNNGALLQSSNLGGGSPSAEGIIKPGTHVYYGDPTWTDVRVSVKFTSPDDDGVGLMARYVDDDNFYRFSIDTERKYIRLVVKANGNYALLAEDLTHPGYSANDEHSLALVVNGQSIEAYFDGILVLSAMDASHASGAVGLYSWYNTGVRFDDLSVTTP